VARIRRSFSRRIARLGLAGCDPSRGFAVEFISKAAQAEIKAALAKKPSATVYSYPGQHHAFSRHNGAHYNAATAALANGRTREFLHQQLR
jgi:dienelactone hydrolase